MVMVVRVIAVVILAAPPAVIVLVLVLATVPECLAVVVPCSTKHY